MKGNPAPNGFLHTLGAVWSPFLPSSVPRSFKVNVQLLPFPFFRVRARALPYPTRSARTGRLAARLATSDSNGRCWPRAWDSNGRVALLVALALVVLVVGEVG